jgi:hypothetical protein
MGVFRLSPATFEEVEADKSATTQAALIVLVIALISGFGGLFWALIRDNGSAGGGFFSNFISVIAGWLVWSVVSWFVGTTFFGGKADIGEMLRVIGFAYSPQILNIIPCIGPIVGFIWSLIAGFIAVRQGLDLDNTKAFLTILVGFLVYLVIFVVLGIIFGGLSLGLGALTS